MSTWVVAVLVGSPAFQEQTVLTVDSFHALSPMPPPFPTVRLLKGFLPLPIPWSDNWVRDSESHK